MAPIVEAEEVLSLRSATLRLATVSAAVTRFLDAPRRDRMPGADDDPARDD
jgi:hypothetical protein